MIQLLDEQPNCIQLYSVNSSNISAATTFGLTVIVAHNRLLVALPLMSAGLHLLSLLVFLLPSAAPGLLPLLLRHLSAAELFNQVIFNLATLVRLALLPRAVFAPGALLQLIRLATLVTAAGLVCRNWTILILAAFRFESVCRPVHLVSSASATQQCRLFRSSGSTRRLLSVVYTAAFLVATPRMFEQEAYLCAGHLQFRPGLLRHSWYRYGYLGGLIFMVQTGIPVLVTIVLSSSVVRVIWRMQKFRRQRQRARAHLPSNTVIVLDNDHPQQQHAGLLHIGASHIAEMTQAVGEMKTSEENVRQQSTSTLKVGQKSPAPCRTRSGDLLMVIICASFFVLETPSFFSKILQRSLQANNQIQEDMILALLGNICVYCDSLVNICIYAVANPLFRRRLWNIIHCLPKR